MGTIAEVDAIFAAAVAFVDAVVVNTDDDDDDGNDGNNGVVNATLGNITDDDDDATGDADVAATNVSLNNSCCFISTPILLLVLVLSTIMCDMRKYNIH